MQTTDLLQILTDNAGLFSCGLWTMHDLRKANAKVWAMAADLGLTSDLLARTDV
jgi:hypothetical protein